MKNNIYILSLFLLFFAILSLIASPAVHAFSLGSVINDIKNIFSASTPNPAITVTSKIELAPGGDINHNGQITSGDIVRFSYTILNTTQNSYKFISLKTNLDTKVLNGISNVQGAVSLDQSNNTVVIPNLTIDKNQVRKISFDAQVNFNKDTDQTIKVQPILLDQKGSPLVTGSTQTVTANKMDTTSFNKFVHITK